MQHCPACNANFPDGAPPLCPTDYTPLVSVAPAAQTPSGPWSHSPAPYYAPAHDPAHAIPQKKNRKALLVGLLAVAALSVAAYFYFRTPGPRTEFGTANAGPRTLRDRFPKQVGSYSLTEVNTDVIMDKRKDSVEALVATYKGPGDGNVKYVLLRYPSVKLAVQSMVSQVKANADYTGAPVQQEPLKDLSGQQVGLKVTLDNLAMQQVAFTDGDVFGLVTASPGEAARFVGDLHQYLDIPSTPALTLINEFQKDAEGTAAKYKGKTITISGDVADIGKSSKGEPLLIFTRPGDTTGRNGLLTCVFDPSKQSSVSGIKKGQTVRIKGRYFERLAFMVYFDHCELQ